MPRTLSLLLPGILLGSFTLISLALAQENSDAVAKALAQGDVFAAKRKFELALEAYHKADKLSRHTSAICYLKTAKVERQMGDFSSALDNAKKGIKAASNKAMAAQGHLLRSTMLVQMAGKPTDKKLKEAESEIRDALGLDPSQAVALFDLGIVLLKQERDPEGIAELNRYILSPGADPKTVAEARRIVASPIRAREPFAPDFSFLSREKTAISNASLRGTVVLLDFWGTWCPPCRESVPMLLDLRKKYSNKPFQIVGISSDDDQDVWSTFIEAKHMDWPEYLDVSGEVQEAFKIESFPTYVVLDKDGVIRFRQSGLSQTTQGDLEDTVSKALKRPSNPTLEAAASSSSQRDSSPALANPPENAPETRASERAPSAPLTALEAGTVSANLYRNEALGMSYEFPQGWIAAAPASLHTLNERMESAAKAAALQQRPELGDSLRIYSSKVIFYASRKGDGNGQRLAIPSIRITAVPSHSWSLDLDLFRQMAERMGIAYSTKVLAPAEEFAVKGHAFLRADFERVADGNRIYFSQIQTLAGDYLPNLELYASSQQELQQVADSLQSMSIADEEP